jgi:hypothetical protein
MDRLLGDKLFSDQRIVIFVPCFIIQEIARLLSDPALVHEITPSLIPQANGVLSVLLLLLAGFFLLVNVCGYLVANFLIFSISISLTRLASARAILILEKWPMLNCPVFIGLMLVQYSLFVFTGSITDPGSRPQVLLYAVLALPVILLGLGLFVIDAFHHVDLPSGLGLWLSPLKLFPSLSWGDLLWISINLGRLSIAALFVGSYLLKPLHQMLSTLWARLVESDKPIFTLLIGGGAAAAKAIEAVIRAL